MFTFLDESRFHALEHTKSMKLATTVPKGYPIEYTNSHVLCGYFEGVGTLFDFLKTSMPEPKMVKSSSKGDGAGFNIFESYEEATDIFVNRPGSLDRLVTDEKKIFSPYTSGNSIHYDVSGDYIDMGRFLDGEPECMGSNYNGRVPKRVKIIHNISTEAVTSPENIQKNSLLLGETIDWLESNQIRTELLCVDGNSVSHVEIVVKKYEQAFDYNDLLVVSHPEFLRRMCFRFDEYSPSWQPGYGSGIVMRTYLGQLTLGKLNLELLNNEYVVISPGPTNADSTPRWKKMKKWLEEKLPEETPSERLYLI